MSLGFHTSHIFPNLRGLIKGQRLPISVRDMGTRRQMGQPLVRPVPLRQLFNSRMTSNRRKPEQGERKVFQPKDQIYYTKGRYQVFRAQKKNLSTFFIGVNGVGALFFGYKFLGKLMLLKPIGGIFWGGLFTLAFLATRNGISYASHYIREINLIQNGKKVEILNTLNQRVVVEPYEIRKPSEAELLQFQIFPTPNNLYPVIIGETLYMIESRGLIEDEQIFKAVINGFQIEKLKSKEDDDVIDI